MSDQIISTPFDYAALDAETRIIIQRRTDEIRDRTRRAAQDIFEIGERLVDVRARLGDESFSAWLRAEFDWSRRTAYNFIGVYERLQGRANFARLDIAASALYLLAAPSTPDLARDEAITRAAAGEVITHRTAQELVGAHRSPAADPPLTADELAALAAISHTPDGERTTPEGVRLIGMAWRGGTTTFRSATEWRAVIAGAEEQRQRMAAGTLARGHTTTTTTEEPTLPHDFRHWQQRAERVGLTLTLASDGLYHMQEPDGLSRYPTWPQATDRIEHVERAAGALPLPAGWTWRPDASGPIDWQARRFDGIQARRAQSPAEGVQNAAWNERRHPPLADAAVWQAAVERAAALGGALRMEQLPAYAAVLTLDGETTRGTDWSEIAALLYGAILEEEPDAIPLAPIEAPLKEPAQPGAVTPERIEVAAERILSGLGLAELRLLTVLLLSGDATYMERILSGPISGVWEVLRQQYGRTARYGAEVQGLAAVLVAVEQPGQQREAA